MFYAVKSLEPHHEVATVPIHCDPKCKNCDDEPERVF